MEKQRFYCKVYNDETGEAWEILVARGDVNLGLKHVLKRFPEYTGKLKAFTMLTAPDENNERNRITTVHELPLNTCFRIVRKNGTIGKNVYIRGQYDVSAKGYDCGYFNDISMNRYFKRNQLVCIDFTF